MLEVPEKQIVAVGGDLHAGTVVRLETKALESNMGDIGEVVGLGAEVVKTAFGSHVTVMGLAAVPERFPSERPL